jgi:hypothetical protein
MEASGQLHVTTVYPQGKEPRKPLDRILGEPQSQFRPYGREKKLLPLPGIEPRFFGHLACSLVTKISRLRIVDVLM